MVILCWSLHSTYDSCDGFMCRSILRMRGTRRFETIKDMNQVDLKSILDGVAPLPRATTLLHESGLRTVLFHLKGGETLSEHHTRGATVIQCLTGQSTLAASDERVEMTPGLLTSLAPGVPHSVSAQQDTLLLVIISEQMPAPS
jgi:quercetin dioxygenase-like cupin family protein